MTPEFIDTVREENKTALSRLGSSKALYADTEGEMDEASVLQATADRAHFAAETLDGFVDDESEAAARDLFSDVAVAEREHGGTVAPEGYEPGDRPAVFDALADCEGTVERVGGVVGWALAASENAGQVVGFFVGQGNRDTADVARTVKSARGDHAEAAASLLEEVATDDGDWDRALAAANRVVEADYDDYFETLEALGANPKPVC